MWTRTLPRRPGQHQHGLIKWTPIETADAETLTEKDTIFCPMDVWDYVCGPKNKPPVVSIRIGGRREYS